MKRIFSLTLTMLLCLLLVACSGHKVPESDDSGLQPVTDMAQLDGMWSVNGATKLCLDSERGRYTFRSYTGLGGQGEFYEVNGKPMIKFNGFLYDFLMRDDGVLLPNQNGEGDEQAYAIHRFTFRPDPAAEIAQWDDSNWDGLWQNAAGETIVIDAVRREYIACSPDYSISGTVGNENEGLGLYLFDSGERAYICPSADGNSFTVSGGLSGRCSSNGRFDGVFYRNGDIAAYADLSRAEFSRDEGGLVWYCDGVSTYFLGEEYVIAEDGFAYCRKDGKIYPAGWIPERPYDPAVDWGENWRSSWDF